MEESLCVPWIHEHYPVQISFPRAQFYSSVTFHCLSKAILSFLLVRVETEAVTSWAVCSAGRDLLESSGSSCWR